MNGPDPAAVEATFSSVANRYDLANHWLSGGIDFYWRNRLVNLAKERNPRDILDLATGSGDVLFALRKGLGEQVNLTGLDFCEPMLEQARQKRAIRGLEKNINQFMHGDCLALPFEDESFDLITIAFGLRNMASWPDGLKEMRRVLKPGGHLLILDFSLPTGLLRGPYRLYLNKVLPKIAGLITGEGDAYEYLAGSIEQFPSGSAMTDLIDSCGFADAQSLPLTFGVASIYTATA